MCLTIFSVFGREAKCYMEWRKRGCRDMRTLYYLATA